MISDDKVNRKKKKYSEDIKPEQDTFYLLELASQTGQFENGMYRFEGLVLPKSFRLLQNTVYQFSSE